MAPSIHNPEDPGPTTLREVLTLLGCLVAAVAIVVLIVSAVNDPANCHVTTVFNRPLHSITSVPDSVTGRIYFLGSGTIQGLPKYQMKEVLADGSRYVRTILKSEATTREDVSDGSPWVVYKQAWLTFLHAGCDSPERPEAMANGTYSWYEIHIPPGSEMQIVDVNP